METRKTIAPNLKQVALMASAGLALGGCGYFSEKDTDTADYKKVTSEAKLLQELRNYQIFQTFEALKKPRWFVSGTGVFHDCEEPNAKDTVKLMEAAAPNSKVINIGFSDMTLDEALRAVRFQFSLLDSKNSFEIPENITVISNGTCVYAVIQGNKVALDAAMDLAQKKAVIDFAVDQNKIQRAEGESLKSALQKEADEKTSALAENAKLKEEKERLQRQVYDLMQSGGSGQASVVAPVVPVSSGIGGAIVGSGVASTAATTNATQKSALAQAGLIGEFASCKLKVPEAPQGDSLCTPKNKGFKPTKENTGVFEGNCSLYAKTGEFLCSVPAAKPVSQQGNAPKATFIVKDSDGQGGRAGVSPRELTQGKNPAPLSSPQAQSQQQAQVPVVDSASSKSDTNEGKRDSDGINKEPGYLKSFWNKYSPF